MTTPSPSPSDPGAPPVVGGTPSPTPSPAPGGTAPAEGSVVNPPNGGNNNTPSEYAVAQQMHALIEALVAGKVAWKQLSSVQQSGVVTAIGLDPSSQLTPQQIEAAAKAYLASPANLGGGTPPSGTTEVGTVDTSAAAGAAQEDPWATALTDLYLKLWGQPPTEKWLTNAASSGQNLFEIDLQERSKPAFLHTKTAEDEYAAKAASIAQAMGLR